MVSGFVPRCAVALRYRLSLEFVVGLEAPLQVAAGEHGSVASARSSIPGESLAWHLPLTLLPCALARLPC
jgi:hypothetical protein